MVVLVHSLSEVTVDAAESVKTLVLVGVVHAAVLPLSKRTLLHETPAASATAASSGCEEPAQPLTETNPTLLEPLLAKVATAELFTVYVPAGRVMFMVTKNSHQLVWYGSQLPLVVGPAPSVVPAAFSSVYETVCPEMVVLVHSLSEVTVDAAESVKTLVLVGVVHAAVLPLSKRTLLHETPAASATAASSGCEEPAQPLTETNPTLLEPLLAKVATAELFTVYVPAGRVMFMVTKNSHQLVWYGSQLPLVVGPAPSVVPAAFSSVYETVCPEMVVLVHSLSEVTVDAAESVKTLVLVGVVHAAVLPLSKRTLLNVLDPPVPPLPQPGWP